jgi:glycine cleavage system H protein
VSYPSQYKYTKEHEWVNVVEDIATIGVTSFAQQQLGEVVFVELPEVGQVVDAGDEVGTIEAVKAVGELYIPLSGEVTETNQVVVEDPALLNDDPHGEGWLVRLRFSDSSELAALMSAEEYEDYVKLVE